MQEYGKKNPSANLADLGLDVAVAHWNLSPEDLVEKTLELGQGEFAQLLDAVLIIIYPGVLPCPCGNLEIGIALPLLLSRSYLIEHIAS